MDDKLAALGTYAPGELEAQSTSEDAFDADPLTPTTLAALNQLSRHKAPVDTWDWPHASRAAVLVALFPSRTGERLRVLFTTRAATMRTHPGQVSLPGGRCEPGDDGNPETTARREAHEETGLPINPASIRYLTSFAPVVAPNNLLVTPVVVIVLDNRIKLSLNADEVADAFSHPLDAFLSDENHVSHDYTWQQRPPHRFHNFSTAKQDVTGFTAQVLIDVAKVAYGRDPAFEEKRPGQLQQVDLIQLILDNKRAEEQKSKL